MKRISPERKSAALAKLLPPYNMTVTAVAQQEGISEATLYNWRNQAKQEGKPVPGADRTTDQWSAEARLAVIIETATLSEAELAQYCRKKGLYPEQICQWKHGFLQVPSPNDKAALKQSQKEVKQLKRELARKEKALAEAAAILVLRKQLRDLLRGNRRGRLTPGTERQALTGYVRDAMVSGARLSMALAEAGLSERTWRRWKISTEDRRATAVRPSPANRLSVQEEQQILAVCHQPEYASLPPSQIVPALADKGIYLASESTFYRVLRRYGEAHRRGRQRAAQKVTPATSWQASGPNQVWTWDITWMQSTVKGRWFYLYLVEDIFSRKIVGYEVYETESGKQAAALIQRTVLREGCWQSPPVLHADNGAAMKSQTLQMKLYELAITPSHSRPRVSNDNAYVESLFRTLKYVPQWPSSGFGKLDEAREWVEGFTQWYNETHRHSRLRYVTPGQRHRGEDRALLKNRDEVYQKAKAQHPERWSGRTRNWHQAGKVILNPEREKQAA
ncbi:IS3 family transposase [Pectobacterium carotovorum]|uniref:IS3 family transposase n=1 Tax=Pectobacterium carotovorum TaxID=554 RepID=UPI001E41ADFE|nr:IS3 family transposase [Pectobacterium carotovorum]UFT95781.1 IS3 family transposase [Pectobacterium carotovorum]